MNAQRIIYAVSRVIVRVVAIVGFKIRVFGRHHYPAEGAALICANHQSNMDPILLGLTCDRQINYLARQSLYGYRFLGWLMDQYNTIPIDREGSGLSGMKQTLSRLRKGEMILMFPEGSRSHNGEVGSLKPGVTTLARRGKAAIVPVGIDGPHEALPRHRRFPRPTLIHVVIGEPLHPEQIALLDDAALLEQLAERIRACHATARRSRHYARDGVCKEE